MLRGKEWIAARAAQLLEDGELVNLGIGLPEKVADYIPPDKTVYLQSENGFIGIGPRPAPGQEDPCLVNAGGQYVTLRSGGCVFDSALSFGLIRGGHVTSTVLGALEVDQEGNIANWCVPGYKMPGMGGAMDLLAGAKRVIVTMEHCNKKGDAKIRKKCSLPLTAAGRVNYIITELCLIQVTEWGLRVLELAPGVTMEQVRKKTEAELL